MSKFKLTQTATEVQNILNNSLQKPTGLTKTKLVGVGVNGQENIEIGDNLTLANGKLSSATGSLPSTIQFDAEGNRTASKDVKVDGKLKLKSLVSASNPDGDITKELGGGGGGAAKIYCHSIEFIKPDYGWIYFNYYSTRSTPYDFDSLHASWHRQMACTGLIKPSDNIMALYIDILNDQIFKVACLANARYIANQNVDKTFEMHDRVSPVD